MATDDNFALWLDARLRQSRKEVDEQHAILLRDVATRLDCTGLFVEYSPLSRKPPVVTVGQSVGDIPLPEKDEELVTTPRTPRCTVGVAASHLQLHKPMDEPTDEPTEDLLNFETPMEVNRDSAADDCHRVESDNLSKGKREYSSVALRNLNQGHRLDTARSVTKLQRIVHHVLFELASGVLILLNITVMALEMQYHGFDIGKTIDYKGYSRSAHDEWADLDNLFVILEVAFNCAFIVEIILRLGADKIEALKSPWVWFDTILVFFGVMAWGGFGSSVDPKQMRVVRLVRILRTLKIIRVVRAFDSLYLLIKSIQASVGALVWSFVFLIFVQIACGMVISQLLSTYIREGPVDDLESRRLVFERFGTFTKTMLTMYEITFANWYPACQLLTREVSESYALFFIIYRCCFGFAVLRVITAVFLTETQRVVAADDQIAITKKSRDKELLYGKLAIIFHELDTNGDGHMSYQEFMRLTDDTLLKSWLGTLEINVTELDALFKLIDMDGSDSISIEEFLEGLARLKGHASSADIKYVMKLLRKVIAQLDHLSSGGGPGQEIGKFASGKGC